MEIFKKIFFRLKNDGFKITVNHYISNIKNRIYSTLTKIIKYLPLRKVIVFECESDMDDNPRAIYEYMLKEKKYRKYRFVWIVKNLEFCQKHYKDKRTVFISRFNESKKNKLLFDYYLSVAKYFLFSHPYWFKKRHNKQIIINTTHGTPFKSFEEVLINQPRSFDFALCSSDYTKQWFLKFLNCPLERSFVCPHPRIDLLNVKNKQEILSQFVKYNPSNKYVICMPTFKQSSRVIDCNTVDEYSLSIIKTDDEFQNLNTFLKENNIHLIVKLHPLQVTEHLKTDNSTNIHYIQNKELFEKKIHLYNLIGCCDALLTDFSSVFFDYILLNKPIAFFTNFFDQYNRGYIMNNPKDYLCGEQINNFDDMLHFLTNIANNNDDFFEKRNHINELVNNPPPANCCETFVKIMFKLKNFKDGENK